MPRYKSVHTGPQIDSGVARALPGGIIDQMRPNRNLLDNWDFRNPVNQRGAASYGAGYTIDRWFSNGYSGVVQVTVSGIVIPALTMLYQKIENSISISLNGKVVTLSVRLSDGTIETATVTFSNSTLNTVATTSGTFQCGYAAEYTYSIIGWYPTSGSKTVVCMKLELGSVSTLANDPPADHEAEKAKCKRYFNLWASEAARTAALLEVGAMRTTPVLSTIDIGGVTYYTASADL